MNWVKWAVRDFVTLILLSPMYIALVNAADAGTWERLGIGWGIGVMAGITAWTVTQLEH